MPLNRRRFASLAAAVLPTLLLYPACAPAQAQTLTTTQLEQQSVSLMRRGKRLEAAITGLTETVRREPTSRRYAVLLACAQAERAYTLAGVLAEIAQTARRAAAQQDGIARWQAAQGDPQDPLYGRPKPEFPKEVPQPTKTSDDDMPLALTENAVRSRVRELSRSSLRLLETASALPPEANPEAQAEMESLSGWTMLVLWILPRRVVPEAWPAKDGIPQGPEAIIASLERAVTLQPGNQSCRLGLADACLIAAMDKDSPFLPPTRFDKPLFEKGRRLLTEAAKRRPRDGALWFRVACLEGIDATSMAMYEPRTPETIDALRKAVNASSNALAWYCLAAALATAQDYTGMMTSLERGNTAPILVPLSVKYAAPTIVAWIFPETNVTFPGLDTLTFIGLNHVASEARSNNDTAATERVLQTARQMSEKYNGAVINKDAVPLSELRFIISAKTLKAFVDAIAAR
ncbi:MAG: hypothetical protein H7Z41_15255 [Cytophagales bacterium]|nr:hypothetical protein [Armatimonadota bacterium]